MNTQNYSGLSKLEATERLKKYGLNDVEEQKSGVIKKFLAPLYSPISLMLLAAAFLSRFDHKIFDFYFILALYFVNYFVQKWQEFKADRAIKELQQKLSFDVSTQRDGQWIAINAKFLVPGDHIRLGLGSIIPADGVLTLARNLSLNEAVLTGESLPKEKKVGAEIFSGSFIATGSLEAKITTTGRNTSFGKTIFSIEQPAGKSILEKDILSITRFLTIVSLGAVIILSIVFWYRGLPWADFLTLDLSLIIAGIPIALPAVMAIILSIGAAGLAKKMVVVRRLSALQDLANVNLLLTDKTGTLTRNEIRVAKIISYQTNLSVDDVIEFANYAAPADIPDAIVSAVIKKFKASHRSHQAIKLLDFIPYDGERKRSTAFIQRGSEKILVSLGASQIIMSLSDKKLEARFKADVRTAADQGFRVLAVAIKRENSEVEKNMEIIGLLFLADPLDENSKETIQFMQANGIDVKMITGDNFVIAERVSKYLGLKGRVLPVKEAREFYQSPMALRAKFGDIASFAEIMPKDKQELVKAFKTNHIIAVTGDGINDLPALKIANVGIAVSNAVSALKSLADIVLLGQGLGVIKDAVLESRKIFVRLYNYSVYRISESFRLIITILVLGILYGSYPLVPLQLILLAFLNDIPIISLAVDRVKISAKPSEVKAKERLSLSLLFGSVGIANSLIFFFLMTTIFKVPLALVQTMFFLKLTVSGHALIFVAHTKERWYKFLPSQAVIMATVGTQIVATTLAVTGFLMPAKISFSVAIFVWVWVLFWMQITELMKDVQTKFFATK